MKKYPVLSRLIILGLVIGVFLMSPSFSQWLSFGVRWNAYPENVKNELFNFKCDCEGVGFTPFFVSWTSRIGEEDLPANIVDWLSDFIAYHDANSTNHDGYGFGFDAAKPYFFKCQHDQYLLTWHDDSSNVFTNETLVVYMDTMNVWHTRKTHSYDGPALP